MYPTLEPYTSSLHVLKVQGNKMSNNYERILEAIKAKNGGEIPSDLYLKTIRELKDLLVAIGGYSVPLSGSKEVLVKRLQRLNGLSNNPSLVGVKRTADAVMENKEEGENKRPNISAAAAPAPAIAKTTTCNLSQGQIVEFRRVMRLRDETHSTLRPLWYKIGMSSLYPQRSGKELVIARMKKFAEGRLAANGISM